MADVLMDILGYANDDGTHKLWAISKDTTRICFGKAYGSSKGLRCGVGAATEDDKLREGYVSLVRIRHLSYGRVNDDLLKGIVGGVSRVLMQMTKCPIAFNETEGRMGRILLSSGVTAEHMKTRFAGHGTSWNSLWVQDLSSLRAPQEPQAVSEPACLVVQSAVLAADSAWNF